MQIPDHEQFMISDKAGWNRPAGRCCLIRTRAKAGESRRSSNIRSASPVGQIGRLWSNRGTIFRPGPLAADPKRTIVTLIHGSHPGRRITLPDGTKIEERSHRSTPARTSLSIDRRWRTGLLYIESYHWSAVRIRRALRLPTFLSQSFAPVAISMNRDNPRHMIRFPGGGSLARAR